MLWSQKIWERVYKTLDTSIVYKPISPDSSGLYIFISNTFVNLLCNCPHILIKDEGMLVYNVLSDTNNLY